jgi:hypothetical protein
MYEDFWSMARMGCSIADAGTFVKSSLIKKRAFSSANWIDRIAPRAGSETG